MSIHILKMTPILWSLGGLEYVGRTKYALNLGNPWSHKVNTQARYLVDTPGEALYRYREWLNNKLIRNWTTGCRYTGLELWEQQYLARVIQLATDINSGYVHSLGCWCINVENYLPVPDGLEKCHAEILYKGCLQLIEHFSKEEKINA
ncbi:DUF4326 domain-containing protein [Nostoc sp. FACHB-280]|uniref:DUF4326 domain-containing protein n=1 Tax=Nostoc sp. FACHB-280 TaxID=2692839 RepID=UPI00168B1DCB|nr:DUF4326 domain-containing protein [Nostoc sp. FACHB-280]MBD2494998.1 DUF4326 domain-containing protein [Nostoc sp. FACHB-280]